MTIELWGLEGLPNFGFPLRLSGNILLGFECLALLGLILAYRRFAKQGDWGKHKWHWPLLVTLILLAPIASQTILIRLPLHGPLVTPGVTLEPKGPAFSLFGALPWMLAAGLLGQWQAALVALAGGLARGGWETFRIFTPLHVVLQAALVAWLIRRDYAEWPGQAARNPLVSGLIGGLFLGLMQIVEQYVYSGGSLYDGLDYAFSFLGPTLLAAVIESIFSGAICEIVRSSEVETWFNPQQLVVGPYNRSLAARLLTVFVILGAVASVVLLYGDWLLAQSSAREMVERQMKHTAGQAGGAIPYFIQTGRDLSRRISGEVSSLVEAGALSPEELKEHLRADTFFNRLAVFDTEAQLLVTYPSEISLTVEISHGLEVGLVAVSKGVPEEFILEPLPQNRAAQIAFLWPIQQPETEQPLGVLVGWTDLESNPLLSPVITSLENAFPGEAFMTDGRGLILLHPGVDEIVETFDLNLLSEEHVQVDTAPDGTRRLVFAYAIDGYPWHIIVTMPMREVQRQALQIATRLTLVIAAVGVVVVVMVYAISRRLTQPLRVMANVARSIARGDLAQPITAAGEDEIGQLAVSFEQMRRGLKARMDEMALLLLVSHQVTTSFELSTVLPPILTGIASTMNADFVRLALIPIPDESRSSLEAFQAGEDPGNWAAIDSQVLALCQERGRFMLENPSRARAVIDVEALTESIESLAALPIKHEDEFVGVLWLGNRVPRTFTPDEENLLSILASQLGIAVANSRLYHRAEQERMRLMAVLEGTPDAVIVVDREGRISLFNPAAAALLGVEHGEVIGKPADDWLVTPELIELLLEPDKEMRTAEVEIDPGRVMFASVSDINPGGEETSGRVCVLWDITHYKKLDSLKSEFVSTVSHDLRAPLTLMRGYATMLSMVGTMNDQQREFMNKILGSVDQMGNLVDNLLDLGRIEAGMGLDLESVDIASLITEIIDGYKPQAANKQITLDVDMAEGMEVIAVDPTLLRQAVSNLVDNAIQYTPAEGQVTIKVDQKRGQQLIIVQDTGVGIAPTDQARIFEKFYRARQREGDREGGLGLGLAIVKSIAEQHGGRIAVESRLGVGSTFTLEIPIRSPLIDEDDANEANKTNKEGG